MLVITYSTAFKALDYHIEKYNLSVEKSQTIKAGMILTAQTIIKVYGRYLTKVSKQQVIDKDNLPALYTNNGQLATLTRSSTRTIQRHIKRFEKAGIITGKISHGSKRNFQLFINPNILFTNPDISVDKGENSQKLSLHSNLQTTDSELFKKITATKSLPSDSGNNRYTNNILIGVNKFFQNSSNDYSGYSSGNTKRCFEELQNGLIIDSGNTFSGYTREKAPLKNQDAREKVPQKQTGLKIHQGPATTCGTSLFFYAKSLWDLAKNTLYKDVYLTEKQEQTAQEMLYKWYEPVSEKKLPYVHKVYLERIEIVRKYLEKDPENRFVQLPYLYFDPKNPSGFTGTKKWHQNHKKRQYQVYLGSILHAQIRRFLNNEKKDTHKKIPSLTMFKNCEKRLEKLGEPDLVKQFNTTVINHPDFKRRYNC